MKRYEVEIFGFGGEFTCGIVREEAHKAIVNKCIEDDTLAFSMENEECDDAVNCYDYNSILHAYGIDFEGRAQISVYEIDENNERVDDEPIWKGDESDVDVVVRNNPYFVEADDDGIKLMGQNLDKKMSGSFLIEAEEEFDVNKLFFLSTLLDETHMMDYNIVDACLYIEDIEKFVDSLPKDFDKEDLVENWDEDAALALDELIEYKKKELGKADNTQEILDIFDEYELEILSDMEGRPWDVQIIIGD